MLPDPSSSSSTLFFFNPNPTSTIGKYGPPLAQPGTFFFKLLPFRNHCICACNNKFNLSASVCCQLGYTKVPEYIVRDALKHCKIFVLKDHSLESYHHCTLRNWVLCNKLSNTSWVFCVRGKYERLSHLVRECIELPV